MKTKAAVLFETGKPLRIVELDMPELQPGQVLVNVAFSGVCRSQLMEMQGKRGPDKYLPHLLGHEGSGIVLNIGIGITKVKAGDHVVLTWIKGKGQDVCGPKYRLGKQTINAGPITTFCTHTIVSENRCVGIPKHIPLDVAALFGCALPTGAGIVMNEIKPKPGSSAAVFGVGGVGLSAIIALRSSGCSLIVAVDHDPAKLNLACVLGATHSINSRETDPIAILSKLTAANGLDYSVDATGTVRGIETAFSAVRRGGGLCIFASHPPVADRILLDPYELICGKRIQGSWGGATCPDKDIPNLLRRCRKQHIHLGSMITHRCRLADVNEALALLASGTAGRIVLNMLKTHKSENPS